MLELLRLCCLGGLNELRACLEFLVVPSMTVHHQLIRLKGLLRACTARKMERWVETHRRGDCWLRVSYRVARKLFFRFNLIKIQV